jgi:hypothetical protein
VTAAVLCTRRKERAVALAVVIEVSAKYCSDWFAILFGANALLFVSVFVCLKALFFAVFVYGFMFMLYDICLCLCYMIYLPTAIGLTPGGSGTVHIYTQTIHRTTQLTTKQYE